MATNPIDIQTLLRQKQLMDQLNQRATAPNPQQYVMQPNLQAFTGASGAPDDTTPIARQGGRGSGSSAGSTSPTDFLSNLMNKVPGVSQMRNVGGTVSNAIGGLGQQQAPQPDMPIAPAVNTAPADQVLPDPGTARILKPGNNIVTVPDPRLYNPNF